MINTTAVCEAGQAEFGNGHIRRFSTDERFAGRIMPRQISIDGGLGVRSHGIVVHRTTTSGGTGLWRKFHND